MIPLLDHWTAIPSRQDRPEWLDLHRGSLDDVRESLSDISRINRWLGGRVALRRFLFPRMRQAGTKRRLRILDVGTGSAAVPLEIARWARRHEIRVEIVALDNNRRHLNIARENVSAYEEIQLLAADVTALPFPPASFDFVLSMLFLHHFSDEGVTSILREASRVARMGIVIGDLTRSRVAWITTWLATHATSRSRVFHVDGPRSVRAAFRPAELKSLTQYAGLRNATVARRFPFRMILVWKKEA